MCQGTVAAVCACIHMRALVVTYIYVHTELGSLNDLNPFVFLICSTASLYPKPRRHEQEREEEGGGG